MPNPFLTTILADDTQSMEKCHVKGSCLPACTLLKIYRVKELSSLLVLCLKKFAA